MREVKISFFSYILKKHIYNTCSQTKPSVHKACWRCRWQFSGDTHSSVSSQTFCLGEISQPHVHGEHCAHGLLSTGKPECCTLDILQSTLEVLTVKSVWFLCFLFISQLACHCLMKGMIHWNWKTSDGSLKLWRQSRTGWIELLIRNPCILFSLHPNSL